MIVSNNHPTIIWHFRHYDIRLRHTGIKRGCKRLLMVFRGTSLGIFGPHPRIRKMLTPIAGCKHLLSLYADWPFNPDACIYAAANHH